MILNLSMFVYSLILLITKDDSCSRPDISIQPIANFGYFTLRVNTRHYFTNYVIFKMTLTSLNTLLCMGSYPDDRKSILQTAFWAPCILHSVAKNGACASSVLHMWKIANEDCGRIHLLNVLTANFHFAYVHTWQMKGRRIGFSLTCTRCQWTEQNACWHRQCTVNSMLFVWCIVVTRFAELVIKGAKIRNFINTRMVFRCSSLVSPFHVLLRIQTLSFKILYKIGLFPDVDDIIYVWRGTKVHTFFNLYYTWIYLILFLSEIKFTSEI